MKKMSGAQRVTGVRARVLPVCAAILLCTSHIPTYAAEPTGPVTRSVTNAKLQQVVITVNKSRIQKMAFPFTDIMIGNPAIAEVIPMSENTLYILGKQVGTTNVSIFNSEKQLVGVVDLSVNPEVLGGGVSDAVALEQAATLAPAKTVNNTVVTSPQQVMLKVRIAEVNRTAARALGVRYDFTQGVNPGPSSAILGPQLPASRGGPGGIIYPTESLTRNPTVAASFGIGNVDVTLEALEGRGLVRRLAEPNLTATTGELASFLAGGEFPIPVVTEDGVGVDYKPFGVQLQFTPTVLDRGRMALRVQAAVSEVAGFSPNGFPFFTTRGAATNVELRDGQSFALAGLLQANSQTNVDQVPWLGSVPIIGALFKSTEFQKNETELVIIVTAHFVKPAKPGQPLKIPQDTTIPANDVDRFLVGDLEVQKRPHENGSQGPGRPTRGQYGHILKPRPPVVAVPVAAKPLIPVMSTPTINAAPVAKPTGHIMRPTAAAAPEVVKQ